MTGRGDCLVLETKSPFLVKLWLPFTVPLGPFQCIRFALRSPFVCRSQGEGTDVSPWRQDRWRKPYRPALGGCQRKQGRIRRRSGGDEDLRDPGGGTVQPAPFPFSMLLQLAGLIAGLRITAETK